MKATAFLTAVLAVSMIFASCKDNSMEVQGVSQPDSKNTISTQEGTLIWSHSGVSIEANGDAVVERELVSQFAEADVHQVLITFDAWTTPENSDLSPTYVPELSVYRNASGGNTDAPVISESTSYEINWAHSVCTDLGGFNPVRFYIALRCTGPAGECMDGASLRISNIKIFRLD